MTLQEYAVKYHKKERTILEYLKQGFILGAQETETGWDIPEDAKLPYTSNRVKPTSDQGTIFKSILRGIYEGKAVSPGIFHMTEEEFSGYINLLIQKGWIVESKLSRDVPTYIVTSIGNTAREESAKKVATFLNSVAIPVTNLAVQVVPVYFAPLSPRKR